MNFLSTYAKPALIGVAALFIFMAGWLSNGWRWEARLERLNQSYAEATTEAAKQAIEKERAASDAVADADQKRTKELLNAKKEIEDLRSRVASGRVGLRITNARCADLSQTTNGSGLGDGGTAELNGSSGQDYFALREGITTITSQLLACQDILRGFK